MSCKHNFIFLQDWLGNLKKKIPDQWVFYCSKCLEIRFVLCSFNNNQNVIKFKEMKK